MLATLSLKRTVHVAELLIAVLHLLLRSADPHALDHRNEGKMTMRQRVG